MRALYENFILKPPEGLMHHSSALSFFWKTLMQELPPPCMSSSPPFASPFAPAASSIFSPKNPPCLGWKWDLGRCLHSFSSFSPLTEPSRSLHGENFLIPISFSLYYFVIPSCSYIFLYLASVAGGEGRVLESSWRSHIFISLCMPQGYTFLPFVFLLR